MDRRSDRRQNFKISPKLRRSNSLTAMTSLRRLPRLSLSVHRALSTTASPLPSPYYVQTFGLDSEQFLLLLPQQHLPLGRIILNSLPPITSVSKSGPTPVFFHAITPEEIKRDWATFVENAGFRDVLQKVVRQNIAGEEMLVNEARGLPGGDGWIHLCDERSFPAYISIITEPRLLLCVALKS
jgi:hypothetical protein